MDSDKFLLDRKCILDNVVFWEAVGKSCTLCAFSAMHNGEGKQWTAVPWLCPYRFLLDCFSIPMMNE